MKDLRMKDQPILTGYIGGGDLNDRMVALRENRVNRTNLANRTGGIPPYFRIIKKLKKLVDELQGLWMVPDQERS
jgi:hypothetical protein